MRYATVFITLFAAIAMSPFVYAASEKYPIETIELENGFKAVLMPFGRVPKTRFLLNVKAGNLYEGDNTWMADLVAEMLMQGTQTRSVGDIAETASSYGGTISASASARQISISAQGLSDFNGDMLSLISDVVLNPAFAENNFATVQNKLVRNRALSLSRNAQLAGNAFQWLVYGDHPMGYALPVEGKLESYQLKQVTQHYEKYFIANQAVLFIVGQYDSQSIRESIQSQFGTWASAKVNQPPKSISSDTLEVMLIDRPDAVQSNIIMGHRIELKPDSDDFPAMQLANTLFGGYFSSRITRNLREEKGFAYSPRSSLSTAPDLGSWSQSANVASEHTVASIIEIFKELERLRSTAPSSDETQQVQNYRSGIHILRNAGLAGALSSLTFLETHQLEPNYYDWYLEKLDHAQAQDLSDAMNSLIQTSQLKIAIVGDVKAFSEALLALPQLKDATIRSEDDLP